MTAMTPNAHLAPEQLEGVLADAGLAGAKPGANGWWHGTIGLASLRLRAHGGWLHVDADRPGLLLAASADAWSLLRCNERVDGPARFTAAPEGTAVVRAELPLCDPAALAGALRRVITDTEALFDAGSAAQNFTTGQEALREATDRSGAAVAEAVRERLAECSWPAVTRPSGGVGVELDVPGAFQQATLEQCGDAVRVEAGLADWPALSTPSQRAIGLLLLTLSRHVKSVRAVAFAIEGRPAVAFNAWVPVNPSGDELETALGALSVACQLAAEETRLLADEGIAREYLASRGWEHEEVSKRKDKTP